MNHEDDDFSLPDNTAALVKWLDDPANFITVERTYTAPPHDSASYRRFRGPDRTVTEARWLNPQYEVDTRACHDSQADVAAAWEDMKFPKHRMETVEGVHGAYIYTWGSTSQPRGRMGMRLRDADTNPAINYEAVQHPDGHGIIRHYETVAAVRTKSGLVLVNEQDYGSGFAVMTRPDEWDYELPLSGVSDVLDGRSETLADIERVHREQTLIRYTTENDPIGGHRVVTGVTEARNNDRQVTRVELRSGAAVILLYDSTANNPDETKCGFYLAPEEARVYDGAQGALDALQPIDVRQARQRGLEVVPSDEYAGNGAGGFYDDALLGDCIIRQGEWYLVPMDEDWSPGTPVYKPLPNAFRDSSWDFSEVPSEDLPDKFDAASTDHATDSLPEGCPDCGGPLLIDAQIPWAICEDCGDSTVYDEEQFEELVEVGRKEWAKSNYEDWMGDALSQLDSHRPRDLAVTPQGIYVRGTFRHIDNEHKMLNLKERWHLAAENTRDVNVFDLGRDTNTTARFE